MDQTITEQKESTTPYMAVYILYLVSMFTAGIAGLIGVIVAYVYKSDSEFLRSHRQYQIRQFWMSFLYGVIMTLTLMFGIGYLIALALVIWSIFRCVKGLKLLNERKEIPNPKTWLV